MAKIRAAINPDTEFLQKLSWQPERSDVSLSDMQKLNLGWYNIDHLAQDQVIIKIRQGSKIDTYRGLYMGTDEDSQSDFTYASPIQINNEIFHAAWKSIAGLHDWVYEVGESFTVDELSGSVVVTEQVEQETDMTTDGVSQLTSDQLASAIMQPEAETDMPRLREMVLIAEDTGFSASQNEQLAPRLLSFAEGHRDSNNPQDEATVWSAIRTGASMLRPQQAADLLLALLEPGHPIETSLVTVKMIGRIFEAQPPTEVDEYQNLAKEIYQIAKPSLNPHVMDAGKTAAKAQLAIYALVAMASSEIYEIIKDVQKLDVTWFTQQTLRELRDLANIWANHPAPVADQPQKLLEKVFQMLE